MWGAEIKEDDIVNLFEYLKAKNRNFFIFPDFTIFYALLDLTSPQPILWFHKGLTLPDVLRPGFGRMDCAQLKKKYG